MTELTNEHKDLGVSFDGEKYIAHGYKYSKLEDAVSYARSMADGGATTSSMTASERIEAKNEQRLETARTILVSSTDSIPGRVMGDYLGLVRGGTCRAKHVGRDIAAGLKNIVGGEIAGYTQLMAEAREEALFRMKLDAVRLEADAVIGVNFSTAMIDVGTAEITAFGTAVKLIPA